MKANESQYSKTRDRASNGEPGPDSPVGRMLLRGFHGVWFVAKVLTVALVVSMAAGQAAWLLHFLLPSVNADQLSGYGWVAGAVLAVIGIPAGWVTVGSSSISKASAGIEKPPGAVTGEPAELAGRIVAGALIGAVVFSGLAAMGVLCWFSLGRCPFLPDSWQQALAMSTHSVASGGAAGIQSSGDDAWLLVKLFFGALLLGAVCGAILLGVFRGGRVVWTKGPFTRPF